MRTTAGRCMPRGVKYHSVELWDLDADAYDNSDLKGGTAHGARYATKLDTNLRLFLVESQVTPNFCIACLFYGKIRKYFDMFAVYSYLISSLFVPTWSSTLGTCFPILFQILFEFH